MENLSKLKNAFTRLAINKFPSNTIFYNSYRNHLKSNVLNLQDSPFNIFIELLTECNVYIVGHSLLYHKLGLDEYNDKLDLFIDIKNLKSFLDKIYMEFIPISLKFTSKYSTLHEDIIEVIYNFTSNGKHTQIYLHIYNNLAIDSFINNNLSIFGIWWNQFETNVNINDITEQLFTKESFEYPKLSNLNLSEKEVILLESKRLYAQYPKPNEAYTEYETMIIKELISNLSIYLFISTKEEEKLDLRGVNQNNLLTSYNQHIQNQNLTHYNTGVNASNKYKILSTLDFILFMYTNKSGFSSNFYKYDLFYKAFIEFATIFDISIKIKNYIDIVIREQILNKYQIEIKIDDKNNIKFDITDVCKIDLLKSDDDDAYIRQVLLFYYKKQIYKLKSNYKFLDLITHKHKLLDINFNINTDIPYKKEKSFLVNIYTQKQPSNIDKDKIDKIDTYDKILKDNNEFTYSDIINSEEINVKDIINYINKDDNIILIEPKIKTLTCISKSSLDELIINYKDNWFYDCSKFKSDYFSNPYIKVCTATATHYIPYQYVYSLLKSKNRVFYINPTDIIIEKTASYKNTPIGQLNGFENGVSSNNCQDNANIKLSTISTLFMKSIETRRTDDKINKISLNQTYPISLIR
jgi:hypothetical protein